MRELKWSNGVEWGEIFCPMLGRNVMTYWPQGRPCYDTWTAPMVDEERNVFCYRFDQDEGCWVEGVYWLLNPEDYAGHELTELTM
ncbi:MAG: hypothetical protein K6T83_00080 [Alicyclobacillus sp.]|nr:hypothetical protein [Alicyclobacillus sp.]